MAKAEASVEELVEMIERESDLQEKPRWASTPVCPDSVRRTDSNPAKPDSVSYLLSWASDTHAAV